VAQSPLMKRLRERARDLGSKAVDELLASESRADTLGAAVRGVQKGRRTLDEGGARMLGVLGLAGPEDVARINKRLGRLRKRLQTLLDDLD